MNLATLRDALETDLDDAGNAIWTTDELDRAIRRALRDYSAAQPRRAETSLTLTSAGVGSLDL